MNEYYLAVTQQGKQLHAVNPDTITLSRTATFCGRNVDYPYPMEVFSSDQAVTCKTCLASIKSLNRKELPGNK
jgi:hypothetical protein